MLWNLFIDFEYLENDINKYIAPYFNLNIIKFLIIY